MIDLSLKAAAILPGLRLQHWDVGMTERGPVLIELNSFGVFSGHQIAYRKGVYDDLIQHYMYSDRN